MIKLGRGSKTNNSPLIRAETLSYRETADLNNVVVLVLMCDIVRNVETTSMGKWGLPSH